MAPRKVSKTTTPGESAAAATPSLQSQADFDAAAYREYLLEQSGLPSDMPPPGNKKAKTTPKTMTAKKTTSKSKPEGRGAATPAAAKTGESVLESPRNAAQPKLKINLKRKASVALLTPSESPNTDDPRNDSATDSTTKTKKPSKKRKVTAAESETVAEPALHDDAVAPPAPPVKKSVTKKRKASAVEDKATSSSPDTRDADDEASPPSKKSKRAPPESRGPSAPKRSGKGKSRKNVDIDDELPRPPPARSELSFIVAAKVKHVQDYINTVSETYTALSRDILDSTLISVPEIDLIAALMRMRVDYEIGDAALAQVSDAEAVIVTRYFAPVRQTPHQAAHITIDATKRTALEDSIQEKIYGHGLEAYSLLELELEMLCRKDPSTEPQVVPVSEQLQTFYDQTRMKIRDDRLKAEDAEKEAVISGERATMAVERTKGVCPIPMV
ncbi:hypothetical protein LTR85_006397 [Meristemomyces frigidus]|nr:hypothetical protein LTR85_006397 [Meristemomyces frigidus]